MGNKCATLYAQNPPTLNELELLVTASETRDGFQRDPRAALLLFVHNSGLLEQYEGALENCQPPTDADLDIAIQQFKAHIGVNEKHYCCAGCGMCFCK